MISRRIASLALFGVLFGVSTLGAGCKKEDANELRVGAFLSLSGGEATYGTDSKDGIDLAVEQVNAAGGIKGKKVKVLYEDDQSLAPEASNKVRQLIDRDHVVGILGEVASSRTLAGGLIANTKKIPLITPASTAVGVTQNGEWVFRTCFTDAQQGEAAARFAIETLKKKKIAILFEQQNPYSSGLAESFKGVLTKMGGEIVAEKGFQTGETNFSTYVQELKAKNPELIYVPVYYKEMITLTRQAEKEGVPGNMFLGGDGWSSPELSDAVGDKLEGAYFTDHYADGVPWPNSAAFVTAFKAKYKGREPNSIGAQAYDAAKVMFDALGRAKDASPAALRDAIASTSKFQGATGTITIDKNRNAIKPVVIVKMKQKRFSYFAQIDAL